MSGIAAIGWQGLSSLGAGVCFGAAEFVWHTAAQKVAMLWANFEARPSLDADDGPQVLASESLDKEFTLRVIKAPVIEETLFRGLAQPALAYGLSFCFPQLAAPLLFGISKAALLSTIATAGAFGYVHLFAYEEGAGFSAAMTAVAGLVFGVVREKFGLIASIAAHATANLCTGLLDKYYPEFLEFSWEKELRIMPPRQREIRLLQESVVRANARIAEIGDASDEEAIELTTLRASWVEQIQQLEAN